MFHSSEEILIKEECETDPRYGCEPGKRPIEEYISKGIINLDKPSGPTSHQVVSWIKDMLEVKKAGHSGTLDPKVTGVLPVAIEESTKILQALLTADKEYITLMHLHKDISLEKLEEVLEYFKGEIYQTPPLKSSVKKCLRIKRVYSIDVLETEGRWVLMKVSCESGTYIRKLCHDIGLVLGSGAHMQDLRRTRVGPFTENSSVKLHDVKDAYEFWKEDKEEKYLREVILPLEKGVEHLKKIWVKDSAVDAICHGANLTARGVSKLNSGIEIDELIAIMTLKNELIALAKALRTSEEILNMDKGIVADLERVIMKRGTYPKKWSSK